MQANATISSIIDDIFVKHDLQRPLNMFDVVEQLGGSIIVNNKISWPIITKAVDFYTIQFPKSIYFDIWKNFILAHQLGHLFLNLNKNKEAVYIDSAFSRMFEYSMEEYGANIFAIMFLHSHDTIKETLKRNISDITSGYPKYDLQKISDDLNVPIYAIRSAIYSLELL